jgi:hypothetical protein
VIEEPKAVPVHQLCEHAAVCTVTVGAVDRVQYSSTNDNVECLKTAGVHFGAYRSPYFETSAFFVFITQLLLMSFMYS